MCTPKNAPELDGDEFEKVSTYADLSFRKSGAGDTPFVWNAIGLGHGNKPLASNERLFSTNCDADIGIAYGEYDWQGSFAMTNEKEKDKLLPLRLY